MWIGLLHHVTGKHEWSLDACQHGPLEEHRDKGWIEKGSVAHQALSEIILNERWLKDVHKYLHFRYDYAYSLSCHVACKTLFIGITYITVVKFFYIILQFSLNL